MSSSDDELDFRGVGGHLTETSFSVTDVTREITKKLQRDRYAWLTTVEPTGLPSPMLVWFNFDGTSFTVYTQPHARRVTHVFQHPEVSLHLESDGFGGGIVIIGGKAAVTAEGVDPRDDNEFWAKYHMEAEALGLGDAIASYSVRITISPTTLRTTFPT